MAVTHTKISGKSDGPDATLVRPSDWNADHVVSGIGTTPSGRLSLAATTPVMTTTVSGATTIYYTPYIGNTVPIYNGTDLVPTAFQELSVATTDATKSPAAIGVSKVNDWFVWSDAGTLRVGHGPDWDSDTARSAGTALVMINGIWLNNSAITNGPALRRGTYVGTTRSNGSSQLDWIFGFNAAGGGAGMFGVWNAYNRVDVTSIVTDSTFSWTYADAVYRPLNDSTSNRISFVAGLEEDALCAECSLYYRAGSGANQFAYAGIGLNSTTTSAERYIRPIQVNDFSAFASSIYSGTAFGFNFLQALEYVDGGVALTIESNSNECAIQMQFRM